MAIIRVWSGSTDATKDGSTWDKAYLSLADADSNVSAGDIILCHYTHDNGGYGSNTTLTFAGNNRIISVDKDDSNKYRAGAKDYASGGQMLIDCGDAKYITFEGMYFGSESSWLQINTQQEGTRYSLLACTIVTAFASYGMLVGYASGDSRITIDSCSFDCSGLAGTVISNAGASQVSIRNPSFIDAGSKTTLVSMGIVTDSNFIDLTITDADLSGFSTVVNAGSASGKLTLRNCKTAASPTYIANAGAATEILLLNSGSETNLQIPPNGLCYYGSGTAGNITHDDTTSLSASPDGTNLYSLKYTTLSTIAVGNPLELPTPLAIWHDASGSKTLTVNMGSGDSGLTDEDVYALVSFGDETANPNTTYKGTFVDTRPTYGNAAAAGTSTYLKTASLTWGEGTVSTDYKFEITGINPAEPGYVYVRIGLTKHLSTSNLWVCPAITLT